MKIYCPNCGAKLNIPERLYGKSGRCPKCKEVVPIPMALEMLVPILVEDKNEPYNASENGDPIKYKYCPYCGEKILNEAIVCKHCKTNIVTAIEKTGQSAPTGWAKFILYLLSAIVPFVGLVLGIIYLLKQDKHCRMFGITCLLWIFTLPYMFVIYTWYLLFYMGSNMMRLVSNPTHLLFFDGITLGIVFMPLSFVVMGYFRVRGNSWLHSIAAMIIVLLSSSVFLLMIYMGNSSSNGNGIFGRKNPAKQKTKEIENGAITIKTSNILSGNPKPVDERTHIILHESYGDMCIIGGMILGEWVESEGIKPYIVSGGTYNFYDMSESLGVFTNGAILENSYGYYVPFKNIPQTDSSIIAFDEGMSRTPKKPKKYLFSNNEYDMAYRLVKKILEDNTNPGARINVKINQAYLIDLNRDGTDEVFIRASAPEGEDFTKDFTNDPVLLYDIVLMASSDLKKFQVFESSYNVCDDAADVCFHSMEGHVFQSFTDFNGDGILEVFIQTVYYEGGGLDVFESKNGQLSKVLSGGCGL